MERIRLSHPGGPVRGKISIGGSKSISNRILIMNALAAQAAPIYNLSDSNDTQTLQSLLLSKATVLDAHHAGTTFRFMTAYLCLQDKPHILTGSDRMKQRPIGPLVSALRQLGAKIDYLVNEGYPPLRIHGRLEQQTNVLSIQSDMSSQYVSALCMIAPQLPLGLTIRLEGELVSKPYLDMTLQLMQGFGVTADFHDNTISIEPQAYQAQPYTVESDWSSASYWYAIAAIAEEAEIELDYFVMPSTQADSIIQTFSENFGVRSTLTSNVLRLSSHETNTGMIEHDFLTHPDIAQTIAGIAAAKGITVRYSGLKTLAIKETDRVAALTTELEKIGITISKDPSDTFEVVQTGSLNIDLPVFETYQDHRMAMALAPLALIAPIEIKNPKVVNKSYPKFWDDLEALGFLVEDLT